MIFKTPPRRQHGLSDAPGAQSFPIEAQLLRQLVHPPLQNATGLHIDCELRRKVAQQCACFIGRLTDDTFRINRKPVLPFCSQNIAVMEVAMQKYRLPH